MVRPDPAVRRAEDSPYGLDGVAPASKELADTEARKIIEPRKIIEARKIIEEGYRQALETLRDNRDRLNRLAHTLLDHETPAEDEAYAAAGLSPDTAPAPAATLTGHDQGAGRSPPVRRWPFTDGLPLTGAMAAASNWELGRRTGPSAVSSRT